MYDSAFDRSHLNLNDADDMLYWCVHLDATRPELQRVVRAVGNDASVVRRHLQMTRRAAVERTSRARVSGVLRSLWARPVAALLKSVGGAVSRRGVDEDA
jgi:hypothetical protein